MSRRTVWTVAVVVVMLVAACGGEAEPAATTVAATPATTSPPATTVPATVATTTTTIPATTTTAEPEPGCGDAELSDAAELGDTYDIDVDGDGADDTVTVFFDPTSGPGGYGLVVAYATGGSARVDRPLFGGRHPIIPLGMFDIEGDGTGELFVIEYLAETGLSYEPGTFPSIVVLDTTPCEVLTTTNPAMRADPGGMSVAIGTYPPQGIQVKCADDALYSYNFYTDAGEGMFRVSVLRWDLAGVDWSQTPMGPETIAQDEMLGRPLLDCGDLQLPDPVPAA